MAAAPGIVRSATSRVFEVAMVMATMPPFFSGLWGNEEASAERRRLESMGELVLVWALVVHIVNAGMLDALQKLISLNTVGVRGRWGGDR